MNLAVGNERGGLPQVPLVIRIPQGGRGAGDSGESGWPIDLIRAD